MATQPTAAAQRKAAAKETLKNMGNGSSSVSLKEFLLDPGLEEKTITFKGREILVKEPTITIRNEYQRRLDMRTQILSDEPDADGSPKVEVETKGSIDFAKVWLCIGCAYDPETDKRLFNKNDEPQIRQGSGHGMVAAVASAAIELMGQARDASKNSNATGTDSSSSESQDTSEEQPQTS